MLNLLYFLHSSLYIRHQNETTDRSGDPYELLLLKMSVLISLRSQHGKMELFLTKSHLIIVNQKKILLRTRAVISNFNLFTAATDKKIIMNGINAFAKYTCIKFVLRTSDHADYVLFSQHSSG